MGLVTRYLSFADNVFTPDNNDTTLLKNSGWRNGVVSGARKFGIGSATLTPSVTYTPTSSNITYYRDLMVTVEIDSVSGGKELGQATYRWRTNYTTAGIWNAQGVSTGTTLVPCAGVQAVFAGGTGNDFELGDSWTFTYFCTYGLPRLSDQRRDTYFWYSRYKAGQGNDIMLWIDAGTVVDVNCFALMDWMLINPNNQGWFASMESRAESGGSTQSWVQDLPESELYSSSTHKICYFPQTLQGRYFLLTIHFVGAEPAGFDFKLGQVFLGMCRETITPDYGSGVSLSDDGTAIMSLSWNTCLETDVAALKAVYYGSVHNAKIPRPILVDMQTDTGNERYWVRPDGELKQTYRSYRIKTMSIDFKEVSADYVV